MAGKRYFEFVEGSSSKFWEIWSDGNEVFTRYGKIGSAGQTTIKDQGSPDGAKKLYDKLVREKTGKGYEEKGGGGDDADTGDDDAKPAKQTAAKGGNDYKARWAAIAGTTGKQLVAALEKEWAFMVETPKCKEALAHVLTKVKSASVEDDKLVVVFDNQYDGETKVSCSPPATEDVSAYPKSWQKFMKYYDGMEVDANLDVPTFFNGTSGSGAFEQDYVEEVEPELYEKAQEKEIEFDVPIDLGQDWVVANPFKKNKLGEPTLYYFSHEGGGFDDPYQTDLGLPAVFLMIMVNDITDKSFFVTTDEADDDGDDASDAEDGGGGGARRFEFSEGSSNKFWEIRVEGDTHTVRFGKIGTDGQTKTKEFESAAAAKADADKLIAEKTKKGYEEV
jgi:predicted DNA-binding WGR domain protein